MEGRGIRAAVVVLAMLAMPAAASAASGSRFITTKKGVEEPLQVRGGSGTEGEQTLDLPPFTVSCAAAQVKGEPSPGYTMLRNYIKLSRCSTTLGAGEQQLTVPAKVKDTIDAFYKGEGDSSWVDPVDVQIPSLKCTIVIPEGAELRNDYIASDAGSGAGKGPASPYEAVSVPTRNLRDFPSGYQQALEIIARQVGLDYSFEGGCAGLEPAKQGSYSGTTVEEALDGDLRFLPGSEWSKIENKGEEEEPFSEGETVSEGWNIEKVAGS